MKKEFIAIFIGVLFIFVFIGVYFAFTSARNDSVPVKVESKKTEKISKTNTIKQSEGAEPAPVTPIVEIAKTKNSEPPLKPINNQKIVDQTLHSPVVKEDQIIKEPIFKEEKPLPTKDTVAIKEKIDIEVTLFDGAQNKFLADYDVEFRYQYKNESIKTVNLKTDKSGKFIFTATQPGGVYFQIFTKDYSVNSSELMVRFGKNDYQAKLYKGGTFEVRATNIDNKVVEDLTIRLGYSKEPHGSPVLDSTRGVYVISNMPLGTQTVSFKASGYRETSVYLIKVESKEITLLEVKLLPSRILYFDLDINVKPAFINISKYGYYAANNQVPGNEKTEVYKNEKNIYELEVNERGVSPVTIYVDKYLPQKVNIVLGKDIYKVSLEEGLTGKLQINNEKGKPVIGASVAYSDSMGGFQWRAGANFAKGTFRKIAITDTNGVALLTGLTEKVALELSVSHKDFAIFYDSWSFETKTQNSKNIILVAGLDITGKVSFAEKPIFGAKIFIFELGNFNPLFTLFSDADGSYRLNHFEYKKDKEYFIKAFHRDYGVVVTPNIKFEDQTDVIDLKLVKEKSVTIKLTDNKGFALSNKNITISHNSDPQSRFSVLTNEKGEYECFNLIHGDYTIKIDDNKVMVKDTFIRIPTDVIVLKAEQKYLKKLIVTTTGGGVFRDVLMAKKGRDLNPININIGIDGNYYLEFDEENQNIFGYLFFEAQGFALIAMGPFDKAKSIPNELNIVLVEGENLRIKVLDDRDHKPISFATVYLSTVASGAQPMPTHYDTTRPATLQYLPTNEFGEILFTRVTGKVQISLNVENYAPFKGEVDVSQTKDFVVKLVKGGGLKGNLILGKNVASAAIGLESLKYGVTVDQSGNFEIKNVTPGEYTIFVTQYFKDGKTTTKNLPTKIKIVNEKILEINLDEVLKN